MRTVQRLVVLGSIGLALLACGDDGGSTPIDAPTGGTPSCSTYCTTIATNCSGANLQYGMATDCTNTCGHFPVGTAADTSGNTLGCRSYHAMMAAGDPGLHCKHAGPGGDGACGANCLGFCTLVMGACTGANQQHGGAIATCMSAC